MMNCAITKFPCGGSLKSWAKTLKQALSHCNLSWRTLWRERDDLSHPHVTQFSCNLDLVRHSHLSTSNVSRSIIEKLTILSEINQVTIMWVPEHSQIQQNETADRLARDQTYRSRILPTTLSLSRIKSKVRNWIEKRKQTEWKVWEKYETTHLCLEGPSDRYV